MMRFSQLDNIEQYVIYIHFVFECFSEGEAQMISLLTCTVIHRYKFKQQVNAIKFSPDGKYFAACCDDTGESKPYSSIFLLYILFNY